VSEGGAGLQPNPLPPTKKKMFEMKRIDKGIGNCTPIQTKF